MKGIRDPQVGDLVVCEDYPLSCFRIIGIHQADDDMTYCYDLHDINEIEDDLEEIYDDDFTLVDPEDDMEYEDD